MALMAAASGLSALGVSQLLTPIYETTTTVRIEKRPSLIDAETQRQVVRFNSLNAEAMWLTNRQSLERVVEELQLGQTAATSTFGTVMPRAKNAVRRLLGRPAKQETGSHDALDKLRKSVKVKQIRGSEVLEIRVNWHDAEKAKDIANKVVDVFIEKYQSFNRRKADLKLAYLEQKVALTRKELQESENKLVRFQEDEELVSSPDGALGLSPSHTNLETLMVEKGQIELSLALATAELEELDRSLADEQPEREATNPTLRAALVNPDSLLRTLMSQAVAAEAMVAVASGRYTAKHLANSREAKELEAIREQLQKELTRVGVGAEVGLNELMLRVQEEEQRVGVGENVSAQRQIQRTGLEVQVDAYEQQLVRLKASITNAKEKSSGLPKVQQEYLELMRERRVDEELYTMLNHRLESAKIDDNRDLRDVTVWDPALAPLRPLKPKPMLMAGVGTFMGLLLGLSIALAAEYLDDSFRTKEEVEAYLRLPVLAELPKVKLPRARQPVEDAVQQS